MVKEEKLSKNSQYLIDYLTKLRQLNKLDVEIPNQDINTIISDPRKYALDFIELEFARTVPKFIKSYKNGLEFGKKNK